MVSSPSPILFRMPPSRAQLRPGLTVDIVQKQDQSSGKLTRGVVAQLLTRSASHPHGIKVRLAGGQVGTGAGGGGGRRERFPALKGRAAFWTLD